jgi:serine/threonine protein kinase
MEYLPGGDLFSVLQNIGCLEEESAKIYAAQIVSALEFLRSSRVIHRDLKPDNILVDSTGRLKLVDFGLSFFGMVDRSNPTVDGECVGTPDYTSPEIVLAQPHTFTADYWALGALLFEFITGSPPFHGETPAETFRNIISGQYPESELAGCSPELRDLIGKLLRQDPEARLGSDSVDEIKNHPWFADVSWDRLEELPTPFVPQLSGVLDTSYFEERISLQDGGEADIVDDIRVATEEAMSGELRGSLLSLFDDDPIETTFQSVAVHRLQETTHENARQLRLSRGSIDCESDDDADTFLSASERATPTRKRSRRRLPRNSLSPKVLSPSRLSPSIVAPLPLLDNAEGDQ